MKSKIELVWEHNKVLMLKRWLRIFTYPIGELKINYYPNCESIAIITGFNINEKYRKKGYGKMMILKTIEELIFADISSIQCTVIETNEPMKKLMIGCGFNIINKFTNKRTKNAVLNFSLNV